MDLKLFVDNSKIKIIDAMRKISENTAGILFVIDDSGKLIGSLTDGDIRRWLVNTGDLNACIYQLMNPNPKFIYVDNLDEVKEFMDNNSIRVVPILDSDNIIVNIYFEDSIYKKSSVVKKGSLKEIPIIIMAGGKGTRLYPYTRIIPKPLIPINDVPIIERIIKEFNEYGSDNIYITLNYKKEMIKTYFKDLDIDYNLHYVEEEEPLGTGGSITLINDELQSTAIVTNCDTLIRADYADIVKKHIESGNALTVVVSFMKIIIPYGILNVSNDGLVESINEKPTIPYLVNTGMYVVETNYFSQIPKNTYYNMTDLIEKLIKNGEKVGIYPIAEEDFLDMGELIKMQQMEERLKDN